MASSGNSLQEKDSNRETVASNATPMKQSQTKVTAQTNAASATKTVAEIMKERGEGCVEDESVLKTPVEVQWVLKLDSTTFNVRTTLLALLKSMATVDNTIYLKTDEAKVVVRNPADLPTAK
eukprot:11052705-Ditylum_brightwellii.AAC.1